MPCFFGHPDLIFWPAARHGDATIGVCTEDASVRYSSRALGVLQGYFGRRVPCFHCQEVIEEPLIVGILGILQMASICGI